MYKWLCALFLFIFTLSICTISFASEREPIPIQFKKSGGGQFIYCNNPEFIKDKDLATYENPSATYLMKNEGLKPGNYSVFFCFYNWTDFDVEPDIEFLTGENADITINSGGFNMPQGYEYWDCIGTWSDFLGINIRTLNRYAQYVPYQGKTDLPKTIRLNGSNDWISKYIYNYDVVKPRLAFNMLVNFTVESGEVDVNFAAEKNHGIIGDRSWHNPNAAPGQYFRDTSVKGIDTETLPMVEANLDVQIDSNIKNGDSMMVKVFNQYFNDGNVAPYWMTNINPSRDMYSFSKGVAAGSDMLSLAYKDDTKLNYYGKDVPQVDRDNIWHFDIYHHDTTAYQQGMPWNENEHIPNAFTSDTLDINNLPNTEWELNLGNFGVTNRYHLTITNSDCVERTLNYMLETSLSSNIIIVRDEAGNMLNPYTLERENAFALCKGINSTKKEDCMFSAAISPGQTKKFVLDVILPTNCYGGMLNSLKVDDHKYIVVQPGSPFPDFTSLYEYKNVFYNGEGYMKWDGGDLYQYSDANNWEEILLPENAKKIFSSRSNDFKIVKTSSGYAARFSGWDGLGWNIAEHRDENKVYFFDEKFNFINIKAFSDYIYDMVYVDHTLYICSDKNYSSVDGIKFEPLSNELSFPVTNGKNAIFRKANDLFAKKKDNSYTKICFESGTPHELFSTGDMFYYRKSWKSYYTDTFTKNIMSVSFDGVNWIDFNLPDKFLELMNVSFIDNKVNVDCRYEVFAFDAGQLTDNLVINLNNELLAFDVHAKLVNDRTMVPLRFLFEKLSAKVTWNEETQEIKIEKNNNVIVFKIDSKTAVVNGQEKSLDVSPYIENDKTMIPIRFLTENLGYKVQWNDETATVDISTISENMDHKETSN